MICPNCGNNCEKGQKFCPECGEPIFQYNKNNGNSNDEIIFKPLDDDGYEPEDREVSNAVYGDDIDNSRYFDEGGQNDDYDEEYDDEDELDDEEDEHASSSTVLLIVVSCLLVIAIIFAVVYGLSLNKKSGQTHQNSTSASEQSSMNPDSPTTEPSVPSTTTTTTPTSQSTTKPQTYPNELRHFVYDSNDIPAKYRPVLELSPSGKFVLTEVYSGVYLSINGTYTEDDSKIVLSVTDYTGVSADLGLNSAQITFTKASGYITADTSISSISTTKGCVFTRNEGHSIPSADYRSHKNENLSAKVVSSAGFLNLRSEPTTAVFNIMTKIPDGTTVSFLGETYDTTWAYVRYSDGGNTYYGWVSSEYLSK